MTTSIELGAFIHPALFYHSADEYVDCLVPIITEGLDAGHQVLVAVPGPNLAVLRDALGSTADNLTMADPPMRCGRTTTSRWRTTPPPSPGSGSRAVQRPASDR